MRGSGVFGRGGAFATALSVAALGVAVLPSAASAAPTGYFIVEPDLFSVDLATGEATQVGALGVSGEFPSLARAVDGRLLALRDDIADGDLFEITVATGAATEVGQTGYGTRFSGLTFGSDGRLWSAAKTASGENFSFLSVNAATGDAAVVAPSDSLIPGLAGSCNGGILGLAAPSGNPTLGYDLVAINPATGVKTVIGDTGLPENVPPEVLPDLAFDHATETLWAVTADGEIFKINRTTGLATFHADIVVDDGGGGTNPIISMDNFAIDSIAACTSRERQLTIRHSRSDRFKGKLTSENPICVRQQRVRIFRRRRGPDLKVASDRTDGSGRYSTRRVSRRGKYYAKVEQTRLEGGLRCAAAKSRKLRVGG